ncbi:prolyl oligopeptidase family serine peptidase [Arthrobacter roseus]|uniref:prolyl oligopeptidase family serine peptidase n=1 Tax=Arthrobacter roseus TaxID=136274 RepID=UPI001963AB55|nr:prolyl oligopeptidase family serine peptidase [Arthrobacter roseus]MBM7847632.1 prolyl oligopeptidase [Arthrobacter roseus]
MENDEFQWLEDIYGERQLDWVRQENTITEDMLLSPTFDQHEARILEVLDSTDRIPMAAKRGSHYYNFWRDAEHPRGVWRRTTWDSYRAEDPQWEVLLDIDELARVEGTEWVWAGAAFLRPTDGEPHRHALISLSPDGGDANRCREYDVVERRFVEGGFDIPSAKNRISWAGPDTLYVGTDFGEGSMTSSSYPRFSRILRRGQQLKDAEPFFEISEDHMMAVAARDLTPGFERDLAVDIIDFYNRITFLRIAGQWQPIEVPTHVTVELHRQWATFRPQQPWEHEGATYLPGSLLVADIDAFMAGERALRTIFEPDDHTSLQSWSWTRDYLLLNLLRDVASEIRVLNPAENWSTAELDACPPLHSVDAYAVDDEDSESGNDYWLIATGFLTPSTLSRGTIGGSPAQVKASPSYFDESSYEVSQHFATSADGTKVPYFQVAPKAMKYDGGNPTLLSGYGGFQQALTPTYSGVIGRGWLERSFTDDDGETRHGVFVLANIRGGGEYGPSWHRAALHEKRHRAYEDFAAIAMDLVERGVTQRDRLGCTGRSNGGLLTGNMITTYPHLFGAVSCGVPLLDMQRYSKLSAGYSWIAEYGDPDKPEEWDYVQTFSPYHLLKEGKDYPASLIWTATSDDRVGPVQARKMAARMKRFGVDNVWFHEALEGGHAGASDNRQAARMHAMSHEFLWKFLTPTT